MLRSHVFPLERVQPSDIKPRSSPPEPQARHRRGTEAKMPEWTHVVAVIEVIRHGAGRATRDAQETTHASRAQRKGRRARRGVEGYEFSGGGNRWSSYTMKCNDRCQLHISQQREGKR